MYSKLLHPESSIRDFESLTVLVVVCSALAFLSCSYQTAYLSM